MWIFWMKDQDEKLQIIMDKTIILKGSFIYNFGHTIFKPRLYNAFKHFCQNPSRLSKKEGCWC